MTSFPREIADCVDTWLTFGFNVTVRVWLAIM